jgi:hypothetical protein
MKVATPFTTSHWQELAIKSLLLTQLVFVSFSFALLTTGMYLRYHMTILTIPTYNLDKLYRDFLFAIYPAVGFGISLYCPPLLVPVVIFLVLFGLYIQVHEVKRLTARLKADYLSEDRRNAVKDRHPDDHTPLEYDAELDLVVQNELTRCGFKDWTNPGIPFESWIPSKGVASSIAVFVAIFILNQWFADTYWWICLFTAVNGIATWFISRKIAPVIRDGGRFLDKIIGPQTPDIDRRFEDVLNALQSQCDTQLPKD